MNTLLLEIKKFSRENWWLYVIFIFCLVLIYKTNSWNLLEVSIVFCFHFLWDVFVMMMWEYYIKNENKKALNSQIWSFTVFSIIWFYTWITAEKWSYLIPQLLFFWPIIKWFFPSLKWLDYKFLSLVWIIVFIFYYSLWLITNIWTFIQILWFIIFPIALIIENKKIRYFLSLIWITFIFIGSAYFLYNWFIEKNIIWTDLSYTLLPLTVVIFYLKNLKKYL
jgi:hypothetical protein